MPCLVQTVGAWHKSGVVIIYIMASLNLKAEATCVSEVLPGSREEPNLFVDLLCVGSDDSSHSLGESISKLVGNHVVSLLNRSDGSGSAVVNKPLSFVAWVVVSDSEDELIAVPFFVPEKSSVALHSRLDLELHFVLIHELREAEFSLIKIPRLFLSILAVFPSQMHVVGVLNDCQALSFFVLDAFVVSVRVLYLLSFLTCEGSGHCCMACFVSNTSLV